MTTAVCPGHNYQSRTANAAMPYYCEACRVWWGLGVATVTIIPGLLPSEDDDGSAAEIARLRSELETALRSWRSDVERLTGERDAARADFDAMTFNCDRRIEERDAALARLSSALLVVEAARVLVKHEPYIVDRSPLYALAVAVDEWEQQQGKDESK